MQFASSLFSLLEITAEHTPIPCPSQLHRYSHRVFGKCLKPHLYILRSREQWMNLNQEQPQKCCGPPPNMWQSWSPAQCCSYITKMFCKLLLRIMCKFKNSPENSKYQLQCKTLPDKSIYLWSDTLSLTFWLDTYSVSLIHCRLPVRIKHVAKPLYSPCKAHKGCLTITPRKANNQHTSDSLIINHYKIMCCDKCT